MEELIKKHLGVNTPQWVINNCKTLLSEWDIQKNNKEITTNDFIMKIKNCQTKIDEDVMFIKVIDGLFYSSENEKPLILDYDHIVKIGEKFYKLKDLKRVIEYCEKELYTRKI